MRNQLRAKLCGGKGAGSIAVEERTISRAGWINRPMRRPEALDAASLLVDQDRCLPSHRIPELANEPAQHIGRRYVAFEKNEPPRVRIADELLFVGGKARSRQSGNKRAHASLEGGARVMQGF